MSLYAVKNDKGEWWDFEAYDGFWSDGSCECAVTAYQERADSVIKEHGGHVVELVEAPAKVVVSEEEAKMLTEAKTATYPAEYITRHSCLKQGLEDRLMRAYVNGYTVAKEKRYLVYKELGGKQKNKLFAQAYRSSIYPGTISWILTNEVKSGSWAQFTESEIEHYGLQDCEKEEVTDDGIR